MEKKYKDAIDRAFEGDEAIIGEWVRQAREKILDIQQQLDNLGEKPSPSPKLTPHGTPYNNNFHLWNTLEKKKFNEYDMINSKVDKSFAHKNDFERRTINTKIGVLLSPHNPELMKKDISFSQDYLLERSAAKNSFKSKLEANTLAYSKSSDRYLQTLYAARELQGMPNEEKKDTPSINKDEISASDRYEQSLSGKSLTEKYVENREMLEPDTEIE
jgi:hypothetical protein